MQKPRAAQGIGLLFVLKQKIYTIIGCLKRYLYKIQTHEIPAQSNTPCGVRSKSLYRKTLTTPRSISH